MSKNSLLNQIYICPIGADGVQSLQHLDSHDGEEDVEDEAETEDLLHRNAEGPDVASLKEFAVVTEPL